MLDRGGGTDGRHGEGRLPLRRRAVPEEGERRGALTVPAKMFESRLRLLDGRDVPDGNPPEGVVRAIEPLKPALSILHPAGRRERPRAGGPLISWRTHTIHGR